MEGIETNGGSPQDLNLEETTLSISAGNSIFFKNWDTNVDDDFSGVYNDLQNKPDLYQKTELYNKSEIDNLIAGIETNGGVSQNLNLDNTPLSISGTNSITFDKWDTNFDDNFNEKYASLTDAPKVYTQAEVDIIKDEIMQNIAKNYARISTVVSISSSRNVNSNDVGNTMACTSSATLTITSSLWSMQGGEVINLEVHTTLKVQGSGTVINGKSNGSKSIGDNSPCTGGLIRKTGNNSYIVL